MISNKFIKFVLRTLFILFPFVIQAKKINHQAYYQQFEKIYFSQVEALMLHYRKNNQHENAQDCHHYLKTLVNYHNNLKTSFDDELTLIKHKLNFHVSNKFLDVSKIFKLNTKKNELLEKQANILQIREPELISINKELTLILTQLSKPNK